MRTPAHAKRQARVASGRSRTGARERELPRTALSSSVLAAMSRAGGGETLCGLRQQCRVCGFSAKQSLQYSVQAEMNDQNPCSSCFDRPLLCRSTVSSSLFTVWRVSSFICGGRRALVRKYRIKQPEIVERGSRSRNRVADCRSLQIVDSKRKTAVLICLSDFPVLNPANIRA